MVTMKSPREVTFSQTLGQYLEKRQTQRDLGDLLPEVVVCKEQSSDFRTREGVHFSLLIDLVTKMLLVSDGAEIAIAVAGIVPRRLLL
jgi:hypothetical protein